MSDELVALLRGKRFVALTGAGCSTESGIPDYRGEETRRRARNPLRWSQYVASPEARARYWSRATLGWARFSRAEPNPAHHALADLERHGALLGVITQNVDRLHQRAGSRRVIELHGALADVRCLGCGQIEERAALQRRLLDANPGWLDRAAELAPDGDADLPAEAAAEFQVAACLTCSGTLKPDVVFFGESVPAARVAAAYALLAEAEVLLVVGSSLAVFSGHRFVLRARERGVPVAIVNLGTSRGDALARVVVPARAGELLPRLASELTRAA